jgi:hypothetical protein
MSWEKVIKRGRVRKIDYDFLNKIIIQEARLLKGQSLNIKEFDIFIEDVRSRYSKLHKSIKSDRIHNYIIKYLKNRNLLETKKEKQRIVVDGKLMGIKTETRYSFL